MGFVALAAIRESPWEDEFHSLLPNPFQRYSTAPLYPAWLWIGQCFSNDFAFLRLWSALPWVGGLVLAHDLFRRLGAPSGATDVGFCFLALNPFLLNECANVRYYGCFLFTSTFAIWSCAFFMDRRSVRRGVLAGLGCGLAILSSNSAGLLALILVVWVGWRYFAAHRAWAVPTLMAAAAFLAFVFGRQHLTRPTGGWPRMVGYNKGPVDLSALGWQYERLMGWSVFEDLVPSWLLEGMATAVAAAAVLALMKAACRGSWALVAMALSPAAFWILAATVVNALNPRYYLFVGIPLALGQGLLVSRAMAVRSLRGFGILMLAVPVVLSVRGACLRHQPPMDEILRVLREHHVQQVAVNPPWFGFHLQQHLSHAGLKIEVVTPHLREGPWPEWVFAKDPRYTWPIRGVPKAHYPFERHYEAVATASYGRRYYFHAPAMEDRLLRRR